MVKARVGKENLASRVQAPRALRAPRACPAKGSQEKAIREKGLPQVTKAWQRSAQTVVVASLLAHVESVQSLWKMKKAAAKEREKENAADHPSHPKGASHLKEA